MAEITPIVEDDFDAVFDKFLREDDDRLGKSDWKRLFQPACRKVENPQYGYKLTHDGKIVGMLGMIQSSRTIESREVRFCNLHSWFVDEQYRGNSLGLLRPILKQKEWVVTDFTPTPAVVELSKRLGFQVRSPEQRILRGQIRSSGDQVSLSWNEEMDLGRLRPDELEVYQDHEESIFDCLLVEANSGHCFVILQRIEMGWQPYASIQYSSNPSVLAASQFAWQNAIQSRLNVKSIVLSRDHFGGEPIGARKLSKEPNQLVRSSSVDVSKIDTLYSEVSLLGLSTLPGRKAMLMESIKKLNPLNWLRSS